MIALTNLILTLCCLFAGFPLIAAICFMAAVGCFIIDVAEARDIARYEERKREMARRGLVR